MVCRKNVQALTAAEKANFIQAVKALKANGKYDQYVRWHVEAAMHPTPPDVSPSTRNAAHRGPSFLPWHREFLRRFESDLQAEVPGVALPYWDWATDAALPNPGTAPVWADDLMGGNGDSSNGDLVQTGPFAYDPADPNTWTIVDEDGNPAGGLQREFGANTPTLPTQSDVDNVLDEVPYDTAPWTTASNPSFRNRLEGWINGPQLHNRVHVWVGGSMLPMTSPNDPVFFLHHCFVDKLWADWQDQNPSEGYLPVTGEPEGHRLNDALYPWSATPADVLNHRDLGYIYDTDPPQVELDTPTLIFNDVPAGETTVRAAVFSISSCTPIHLEIISGPTVLTGPAGTSFGTPLGTTVTANPELDPKGRVWISYTGTAAGDTATGTVTIRCVETAEEWTIPITANTIARPTVAAVLALDKSNSMNFASGIGTLKRIDVLKFSAPPFADLIQQGNAIGIVSFDQDAYDVMPVTGPLDPPGFPDVVRGQAKTEINNHTPNPQGNTSIGDAVALAHTRLEPVTGYDIKATIVLTDGQENQPQFIADVADVINERVYAIGLGTAEQLNPVALTALTNGTGGYLLMTGALDINAFFRVSKYYLQILAGVTNEDVVLDPEGWLSPGDVHRIPFRLSETDITSDIILLTPDPRAIRFTLETPNGDVIDPGVASTNPTIAYIVGSNVSYYRMTLPVPIAASEAREGTWYAVLALDDIIIEGNPPPVPITAVETAASTNLDRIHYSLNVHTYSNLRMRSSLSQNSHEPGATLTLRAVLTEYGLPVANRATVRAELERPDKTMATLTLAEVEPGVFETTTIASMPGAYQIRTLGTGHTFRGRPFTREQLLTGAVWKGGDQPPPTSRGDATDCCRQSLPLLQLGIKLLILLAIVTVLLLLNVWWR